jgi:multiple sugar transport system substrate-binding protein
VSGSWSRRRVLGHIGATLRAAAVTPLVACVAAGGAVSEVAPAAQLRKGTNIVWAVDEGATRTLVRQEQVKLFKEQFPDIGIEFMLGATSQEKVQTLFAAGTPPDLFRGETPILTYLASRAQLVALDPLIRRDKYDRSDFFPNIWEHWGWKGKLYGVPFLGVQIAYYNRSLAQRNGLKLPSSWGDSSWTWDAFLDVSRKATVRQGGSTTQWGNDLGTTQFSWQPWVWANGGEVFSADGTKILLGEPAAVEALQFRADLIHKHGVAPTTAELAAQGGQRPLFLGGKLLLYYFPIAHVGLNRKEASFDWSVTALPRGKGKPATYGGGVGWFLASATKVKDETWEFMKLLASKESVRLEALRGEAPPSRKSVASEPGYSNPPEAPGADMKMVVEALGLLRFDFVLLEGVKITAILTEELEPMWQGTKTAREAVGQAVDRIKPLLNPPA